MSDLDAKIMRLESALADIAESVDKASGARGLAGIHSAIADAVEAIQTLKAQDLTPLVQALRDMKPSVHVSVPQALPPVVHVVPAAKFTVTLPAGYGHPERTITIVREPA